MANEVRAYFARAQTRAAGADPVDIGRRADRRVDVEVRVPPFARPQELAAGQEMMACRNPNGSRARAAATARHAASSPRRSRPSATWCWRSIGARWPSEIGRRMRAARDRAPTRSCSTSRRTDSRAVLKRRNRLRPHHREPRATASRRIVQARAKARQEEEEQAAQAVPKNGCASR